MKRVYLIILLALLITHGAGLFNGITWDDRYLLPKAGEASLADVFLDRNAGSSGNCVYSVI